MAKLAGKYVLITGGSSGIGLATAKLFQAEGARVAVTGRKQQQLDEAKAQLGDSALVIQADTASMADTRSLFDTLAKEFGKLDVVFANAGIAPLLPFEAFDEATYDQIMDVNVKGLFFTLQAAVPLMTGGGSIVLTTSVVNVQGMANSSVYSASKAAVRSLARTLSGELVGKGIRVNAISPGPIETPIIDKMNLTEEEKQQMAEGALNKVPMNRFGQPEEVAKVVLFLASEDASYVLGVEIAVDGGMTQL